MKQKIILLVALLSILLTGCSNQDENSLVEQGKNALEKHKYSDAREFLSQALEVDSADENARAMYMQAMRMENTDKYKGQGNYKKAIKELELLEKIKGGSSTIKNEASNLKKELEKLNEQYKQEQEERKENAKLTSKKDKHRVERDALNSIKKEEPKKEEVTEEKTQEKPESKPEESKPESKPETVVPETPPVKETLQNQDATEISQVQ